MNIPFMDLLIQNAGLLSLAKSDCDLFFIAQANSITYSQLDLTELHGRTRASGRLSLKHLEKEGYILSQLLPGPAKEKYFTLSAKGKNRLEKLFGEDFLVEFSIDLARKPPSSSRQLPHRIHTGDLFFCFLSNPFLAELPVWQLESSYQAAEYASPAPRCDAMLSTSRKTYYIEQDNNSQGEAALSTKILQYMKSPCFLGDGLEHNGLVFSIHCAVKERRTKIPPFSVYRILLKAQRVWNCLEMELGCLLSLKDFCAKIEHGSSPALMLLSASDKRILKQLAAKHPSLHLKELDTLKRNYLYDSSSAEERLQEQDAAFVRRLRQKFYPIPYDPDFATLKHRLQKGLLFSILPNHRLKACLPFTLQAEYGFSRFLYHLLYSMGISETERWTYHETYYMQEQECRYFFRNVFACADTEHLIVAEEIAHDLGGRERVRHFLAEGSAQRPVLFLLFVSSRDDAVFFLSQHGQMLSRYPGRCPSLCFLDESEDLFLNPQTQAAYFKSGSLWLPAQLEFDQYLGELRLTERRV